MFSFLWFASLGEYLLVINVEAHHVARCRITGAKLLIISLLPQAGPLVAVQQFARCLYCGCSSDACRCACQSAYQRYTRKLREEFSALTPQRTPGAAEGLPRIRRVTFSTDNCLSPTWWGSSRRKARCPVPCPRAQTKKREHKKVESSTTTFPAHRVILLYREVPNSSGLV